MALRLMIYDRTCRGTFARPGLSHAWWLGGVLYQGLGRFDAWSGFSCWSEALSWVANFKPDQAIAEIQYWGHGKWGYARLGDERLDREALGPSAPHSDIIDQIAARMLRGSDGLWWFRTCETFGGTDGHRFAAAVADRIGCRVAGHTHIIGHIQSGLHSLMPGASPDWDADEGIVEGTHDAPLRAAWSRWNARHTITCLRGDIPTGY